MIVVLFGQPGSGKTTIAKELGLVNIDGDVLRNIFNNNDYSREGRLKNLNRASDIAVFMDNKHIDVSLSVVYPYKEAREYLNSLACNIKWIHLIYDSDREKQSFKVEDFDIPLNENVLTINTTNTQVLESVEKILEYCKTQ
tara:strand:+ start:638 stop:1060 length:423 start_codon:yes stop_codon:yes gene_type:complete